MPSISTWKINNQIAALRDGTKGQPNGAVSLNAQGKIDKFLLKAYADDIKVRANDSRTLAEYISAMKVGMLSLPLTYTDAETDVNTEKATCIEGTIQYILRPSGIFTINDKSIQEEYSLSSLSLTSISKAVFIPEISNNARRIFARTNKGVYIFNYSSSWFTLDLNSEYITDFAIDRTAYVGRAIANGGVKIANNVYASPTNWIVDSTWPSYRHAYSIFFCHNKWFVCGDSIDYGNILYEYNATDAVWQPYHTNLVGNSWTGMLWVPYKSAYIIWSNTEIWIITDEQLHWWQFLGLNSGTIIYSVACSEDHIVVATSKGLYYSDLSDCIAIPTQRPVLSFAMISANRPCYTVAYEGGLWFVSASHKILYSFDAITWYDKQIDATLLITSALWTGGDRWLLLPEPDPNLPAAQLRCKAKLSNIQCIAKPIYL